MRMLAGEIGHHRALPVGPVIDADIHLVTHPGLAAIGAHQQGGAQRLATFQLQLRRIGADRQARRAAVDETHVRGETQRRIQRQVQVAVLDDPRQRPDPRAVGIEGQLPGRGAVAVHHHALDRRHPRRIQRIPHLQRRQQLPRHLVQGVHPQIPIRRLDAGRGDRRRRRTEQSHAQTGLRQCQRRRLADYAIADDADIAIVRVLQAAAGMGSRR